jgi:hypothetical protein
LSWPFVVYRDLIGFAPDLFAATGWSVKAAPHDTLVDGGVMTCKNH